MPQTNEGILLVVGAIFFLIGLLGGGLEISAVKIPPMGKYPRIFSSVVGAVFMAIAVIRLLFPPTPSQISAVVSPTTEAVVGATLTITPMLPTDTPLPTTDTPTPEPPTDTPQPKPTDTPKPENTSQPFTSTPSPVPTSTPTPTPTPLLYSQLLYGELLLEDTFDDNRYGWGLYPSIVWIEDGKLHIFPKDSDADTFVGTPLNLQDFIYETTVTIVEEVDGPKGNIKPTLCFRVSPDVKQFYTFGTHGDRGFQSQIVDRTGSFEQWENLVWQDSYLIDPERMTHKIIVVARGDELQLWVDDKCIHSLSDSTYSSGAIGLASGRNIHAAFDYVRVWALP